MQHTSFAYTGSRSNANPDRAAPQPQSGGRWQPSAGSLLVVSAHPQDEVLAAGGLIHTWVSWGHGVTVLSVTDGEGDKVTADHLDLMRRDELRSALRKLCATHVAVVRMGLRDGQVGQSRNRLRQAIDALLESDMTLIAPFEQDGHPDKDAVGKVCREAAQAGGLPLARYVIRSGDSHAICPEGTHWGRFPLDMEARRAKAHALHCFNSQRDSRGLTKIDPSLRSFEAFLV
jgi:LmbE family N-acetylglucosaminyl deacetylase